VSKVDLRLQCGMPCSKLEVSTVQHGTLSGTGYLHQSPRSQIRSRSFAEIALREVPKPLFIDGNCQVFHGQAMLGFERGLPGDLGALGACAAPSFIAPLKTAEAIDLGQHHAHRLFDPRMSRVFR
jgi:hypothetical protein